MSARCEWLPRFICSSVMIRSVFVLLTIFGLLACPVHCTSGKCIGTDGSAGDCPGCSPHCPSNSDGSDPTQPGGPDGAGENCHMGACRGFLGQSPRRPVVDCRLILSFIAATPDRIGLQADPAAGRLVGNGLDPPAAWPAAGRELCIAVCSLLF